MRTTWVVNLPVIFRPPAKELCSQKETMVWKFIFCIPKSLSCGVKSHLHFVCCLSHIAGEIPQSFCGGSQRAGGWHQELQNLHLVWNGWWEGKSHINQNKTPILPCFLYLVFFVPAAASWERSLGYLPSYVGVGWDGLVEHECAGEFNYLSERFIEAKSPSKLRPMNSTNSNNGVSTLRSSVICGGWFSAELTAELFKKLLGLDRQR